MSVSSFGLFRWFFENIVGYSIHYILYPVRVDDISPLWLIMVYGIHGQADVWPSPRGIVWRSVYIDGKGLMSGGEDGVLRYWDVNLWQTRRWVDGTSERRFQQIRKFEGHILRHF
jgi:hypothetical protein